MPTRLKLGTGDSIHLAVILGLYVVYAWISYELLQVGSAIPTMEGVDGYDSSLPVDSYSYIGMNKPKLMPMSQTPVRMVVEESVHYSLQSPDSQSEWLWSAPLGDNYIRYGPEMRTFIPSMYHELHCLRITHTTLKSSPAHRLSAEMLSHTRHCLTYLKQWILCSADTTLEPGDFKERDFEVERTGATHTCRDWDSAYDVMKGGWKKWRNYQRSHNMTLLS